MHRNGKGGSEVQSRIYFMYAVYFIAYFVNINILQVVIFFITSLYRRDSALERKEVVKLESDKYR